MAGRESNLAVGSDAADPRANGSLRKRDRANEPAGLARAAARKVPRFYPSFVDMGALTLNLERGVRYSEKGGLYDVRDILECAYGNKRAVSVTSKKLGKDFGIKNTNFLRARWSDDENSGTGRVLADAKTCCILLRASIKAHSATRYPITADQTAHWFAEQADCASQPTLLPTTESAYGRANEHPGA